MKRNRRLYVWQNLKDFFFYIISSFILSVPYKKDTTIKIRFQTKDDVIARPYGALPKQFEKSGTYSFKEGSVHVITNFNQSNNIFY